MNWVRHGGSATFEGKSSYCRVAQQGLPCCIYTAVARLGFKRRATASLKTSLGSRSLKKKNGAHAFFLPYSLLAPGTQATETGNHPRKISGTQSIE